jgi:hypothetical protein
MKPNAAELLMMTFPTVLFLFILCRNAFHLGRGGGVKKADRVESESEKQSHLFFLPSPFPSPPIKHGEATTGRGENSSVMKAICFFVG